MDIADRWSPFLLEGEKIITKFDGIRLRNTNDDGILLVTNFQFLFVSKETKSKLGTIPLTTVEQIKEQDVRSFEIIGHDMRVLMFDLKSEQKQELSKIVEYLTRCAKPSCLVDLFAFALNSTLPAVANRTSSNMRLLKEYQRLFCKWFPPGTGFEIRKSLEDKWWRVTEVNSDYSLCSTYPSHLIVPRTISDEELQEMSTSRALSRLPVISWCDFGSGAVLARSSQPMGIKNLKNRYEDEKLVSALRTPGIYRTDPIRKLYIVDARPGVSDVGNGGGSESACSYPESEVVYLGFEDVYEMRVSFSSLRKYVDTHGSISSNGLPLAGPVTGDLVNHGSAWGGGTINSMTNFSIQGEWLNHIQIILIGGSWIAEKIAHESASVLVHCSDGWDRTTQLVGLASLLLDPYYRTFTGFQALVEKDWLAFGHQFAERMGLPTIAKGGQPANPSVKSQASDNKTSPVLLQWLECIAQLLRMYPSAFEFSTVFLVDFIDAVLSCCFGNFLCNSEWEREQAEVESSCPCIWKYLADLRASGGIFHEHRNPFYKPSKYNGPIVPPSPALTPTLWPEFYLRWACPLESQGGGRERKYVEAVKTIKDAESRIIELERMIAEENMSRTVNSDAAKPSGGRKKYGPWAPVL